ncbi:MAG: alkyl sulfatase dimerization domain-containing protein [Christensenellales bacterium]|jgi:alkyl sulfatase BDS1-like metallo-beta-lactamase superfamily hydrolase
MKTKFQLLVLVTILALVGTAVCAVAQESAAVPAPYEPEAVPVHPTLLAKYEEFFPPAVLNVTDGVWVARGYNRDNPVLIEGDDGLIVVDPGESVPAAQKAKDAFNANLDNIFDKKPVKAIIYTHHHDCHIKGASVFANEQTEIIGHESFMDNMYGEFLGPVYPSRAEGGIKMTGILFQDAPVQDGKGWYAGYVLAGPQILGPSGFLAPTKNIKEETSLTIAGVDVDLFPVAGETTDVLLVWLPQKEVLIQIAVVYEAFPAISTMRGSRLRDPLDYVNALKIARGLNPEYLVTIHGPNPITSGEENVNQYLTNFSDAIQFVNDQTLYYMNRGYTPGKMMDLIVLPPHLASSPYLQETYGTKDWNIVHIFRYNRGYYTGEVRDLFPQTTQSEAEMSAFLAQGEGDLASKAKAALDINPVWALRLADDALVLDPDNPVAFETKKAAMLTLAEKTINSQARNMLLSDYLLMTGQTRRDYALGDPKLVFLRMDDYFVELMPMTTLHRIMAVSLNASKSVEKDILVNVQLTDNAPNVSDHYTLNVRKGILEVDPPNASKGELEIVTDSMSWKQLVLSKLNPEDAVANGKVVISEGTPESFYSFMELFN